MISIKKVRSENDGREYFLITKFEDDGVEIEITVVSVVDFKCYRGILATDYLKLRSSKMRMPYKTYLFETQSALTLANPDQLRYTYNVVGSNGDIVFEWKKQVEEEELKIVFGSITLSAFVMTDLVILLLSNLSGELKHLYRKIDHFTEEQNQLKKEKDDLLVTLEESNEWKSNLETEMYAKFVLVLNSKKKKIKELKDQLEEFKGINKRKRTIDKETESTVSSENKKGINANSSLDIFSDDELDIASASMTRTGRYISSNQQSRKVNKIKELASENNEEPSTSKYCKSKCSEKHSDTLLISDQDSDELFDEL